MGFEDSDLDLLTDWVGSDTGLVAAMKSAAKLRVEAAGNPFEYRLGGSLIVTTQCS